MKSKRKRLVVGLLLVIVMRLRVSQERVASERALQLCTSTPCSYEYCCEVFTGYTLAVRYNTRYTALPHLQAPTAMIAVS